MMERQERSKKDLEIVYEMLYHKYNNLGINLPRLSEVQNKEAKDNKPRHRRTQMELHGKLGYKKPKTLLGNLIEDKEWRDARYKEMIGDENKNFPLTELYGKR